MINGVNILALQKILGHSSLAMTMRYAHLSPDHLVEARTLNPLSRWKKWTKVGQIPKHQKQQRASTTL